MAVVDILNTTGDKVSQAELTDEIFNVAVKPSVLHEVVTAQLAGRRKGTASVKRRSDVRGSGKKLYRQKGTGRARKGDIKSPILRGGGVVFGPEQRSYAQRIPKKVKRLALKMALSSKLQAEELMVLDSFELEEIKTKAMAAVAGKLGIPNALIVTSEENRNLELSARNLPGIKVLKTEGLNVYDILRYNKLVILESSLKGIEGRLLK
jgi:large subunit ribosomal protein L4